MSFTTNLNEVPIRPGKVLAVIAAIQESKTKKGDPMVVVRWRIEEGPDAGRIVTDWIAFVPGMVGRNNHLLKLLDQPHGAEAAVIDPGAWLDRAATIKIVHEAGQDGVTRAVIAEYDARGEGAAGTSGEEGDIPF